jgi:ABC-type transport system involved in cytochrome c biogenesis permease subunit
LQIVSNNGWMIPYVSCMIVGVGMCYQFILTLLRFLNRWDRAGGAAGVVESVVAAEQPSAKRSRDDRVDAASERETRMWARWLPIVVCTVFGVYVLSKARPPRYAPNEPNLQAFGQLPVVAEGRIKPFDSLARNSLLLTSGRQDYRDKDGKKQPAIRWLLDTISGRPEAYDARVFRITNLEVLKLLKLEERSGFTYAWNELKPQLGVLQKELETLGKSESEERAVYRRGIGETAQKLSVFLKLGDAFDPVDPQLPTPEEMKSDPEAANAKLRSAMMTSIRTAQEIDRSDAPRAVPMPAESSSENAATTGEWKPLATELLRAFWQRQMTNSEPPEQLIKLETALNAYRQGRTDEFNAAVQDYSSWLKRESLPHVSLGSLKFEQFFNSFAPFYWSMVLCVFVFLLTMLSWLGFTEPLRRSAFWLMLLTFFLHTFALGARIYISGRPPVTNLYTTGIFIGWAVVLLGLGCEAIYRIGVGNAVASMAGFITLGISHVLMDGKDTFSVLQAVLDTGIWLGTHVVTINLGYAATAAAGLFGVYFTVYRLLASKPNPVVEKAVSRMMYGTLCFAILFSFIGTVLGGLWADDSWGRFWGWDPKENGALIIVLWNALVLHAKWDGMAKNRGMAVLTTLGLVAVSWSWFGTNQLGAGLHSYGFTDAARISLFAAWGITIVLAGLGCLPDRKRDLAA